MALQRLSRGKANMYLYDYKAVPALRVKLGESFVIESEDALGGAIRTPDKLPTGEVVLGFETIPAELNPVGGPVYIEGVERGDVLVVNIEKIIVDLQGFTCWTNHSGGILGPGTFWPELEPPYSHIIKHLLGPSGTTSDGKGVLNEFQSDFRKVTWDLAPFVGTLATAPEREIESSLTGQGPYGGNMDVRDLKEGTKVYFPVYHDGGLLFSGDVHGSQGDTEFYGFADESRAEVTYSCDVIKNKTIPNPRLEKADSIITLCSYRPLEEAVRKAIFDLMDWMITDYGMNPKEPYIHISTNPDFRINVYQMVPIGRINYTVGAEIPKKYLWYQGASI